MREGIFRRIGCDARRRALAWCARRGGAERIHAASGLLGGPEQRNTTTYRLMQGPATRTAGFIREDQIAGQP